MQRQEVREDCALVAEIVGFIGRDIAACATTLCLHEEVPLPVPGRGQFMLRPGRFMRMRRAPQR